ncbi:hypothetical protein IWX84_001682 [Flavobacterium sp. CG_9.10]|uniref:hypothetical protein n=1 Tax=Flavobacterium sp. CG_9.10 TaxID=2787729 RepID=UPI0018CB18CB|nr:hypothetical protein [Flavobacterium sp. CG_9.10]MBG6110802.1 hypothetical protein [Flavobacterium sp. CG_9.10]
MKKLIFILSLTFLFSCSKPEDNQPSISNVVVESVTPTYGYAGDEITFNMSENLPSNSNVSIFYGTEKAIINSVSDRKVKFTLSAINGLPEMSLNGKEVINTHTFSYLSKFIECSGCKEKVYPYNDSNDIISYIADTFEINNTLYLIRVTKDSKQNYKTYLINTDINFNIIKETLLFNEKPLSKAIVENNTIVLNIPNTVFSFDLNGNKIWVYTLSSISQQSSDNSILKYNSYYYVIKSNINDAVNNLHIEIAKIDHNGKYISSIFIPNPSSTYGQWANSIVNINNKIVVFTSFCCGTNNGGHVVIDINDKILKNVMGLINVRDSDPFIEGNSVYYGNYANINNTQLIKITLDANNDFKTDWIKDKLLGGIVV